MRRLIGDISAARRCAGSTSAARCGGASASGANLNYGAFFGTSNDRDGLAATKVYYETEPSHLEALPGPAWRGVGSDVADARTPADLHDDLGQRTTAVSV